MEEEEYSFLNNKPDFDIPENKKDASWYKDSVLYYTSFYNRRFGTFSYTDPADYQPPVDRGLYLMQYLFGKQKNLEFNHIVNDPTYNTQQATWQKGKKVKQLIDHMKGSINSQLENKVLSVKTLSRDASDRRTRMYEDLMLKYDTQAKKVFDMMASFGVEFSPEGDKKFESVDDIERFMEYDFKETSEVVANDIANHIEENNDSNTMYQQAFEDFAACNWCGVDNFVENGQVKQRRVPFYNLIWDAMCEDKFNRKARFVGKIERLTPEEVFSRFPNLTKEQKENIKSMAKEYMENPSSVADYNWSQLWWAQYEGMPLISAVTVYWIGRRDTRYEINVDKYGVAHYEKIKNPKKNGKNIIDDVYKGILVGGRYLVEYGPADNVIRDPLNKNCPELPIKIFTHNTLLGEGVSPIGMVYQNQDRMDLYKYKIIEKVGRDGGKGYIINGNKIGKSILARELLTDLKSMGVHVYSGLSGEDGDATNSQSLIETVDLTLDPTVGRYIELYMEEERIMENVLNIPKIALGQQQTYVGLGTQKGTIQQATLGLSTLYKDFVKFNEINIQYATNLAKVAYTSPDIKQAPLIVGDRGVYYLKLTKDFKFEDFLIYIKVKDIIDDAGKQRLLSYAQAWSQNPEFGIGPLGILLLEKANSYSEAFNDLEYLLKKFEREKKQAIAEERAFAQQQQQQMLQAQQGNEAMKQSAEDDRNEQRVQGKMFGDMLKAESNDNNIEADQTEVIVQAAAERVKKNPLQGAPVKK